MSEDPGIYDFAPDETPKGPPPVKSAMPMPKVVPLPCPDCGYELRGTRLDRCPECGKVITTGVLNRITNRQRTHLWRDLYREPVLWAAFGTAVGLTGWGMTLGPVGLLMFLMYSTFTLIVGWVVYLICSLLWIGFDQKLHTIAVQLAGVYLGSAGLSVLVNLLIPIPVIPWIINWFVLLGLLQRILDIDRHDAWGVAMLVGGLQWFILVVLFVQFGI